MFLVKKNNKDWIYPPPIKQLKVDKMYETMNFKTLDIRQHRTAALEIGLKEGSRS